MIGISRTLLANPVSRVGSLSMSVQQVTVSTPKNLSTEGGIDWVAWCSQAAAATVNDIYTLTAIAPHWKIGGGWLRRGLLWTSQYAGPTFSSPVNSLFPLSANLADDGSWQATDSNLSASAKYAMLSINNTLANKVFGAVQHSPASAKTRFLRLYFNFAVGAGGVGSSNLTITASLSDGSAGSVVATITPGFSGAGFYVVTIPHKASMEGVTLVTSFQTANPVGDSGVTLGMIAATLANL